jgi:hypothetical protein
MAGSIKSWSDKLNTGRKKYKVGIAMRVGAILIIDEIAPVAAPIRMNNRINSIVGIR